MYVGIVYIDVRIALSCFSRLINRIHAYSTHGAFRSQCQHGTVASWHLVLSKEWNLIINPVYEAHYFSTAWLPPFVFYSVIE